MSIEQQFADLIAVITENNEQLKILNAGREQALAAVNKVADAAADAAPRRTRAKKSDETPAPGNAAVAAAPTTAPDAGASPPAVESGASVEEQLRDATSKYVDSEGLTAEQKAARIENIKAIMAHFGGMLCGPASNLDDEQRAQALFYVQRYAAGCEVNYSQEYDFAGDPSQGAAGGSADEFDIG